MILYSKTSFKNVRFQDFWYTKIDLIQKYILLVYVFLIYIIHYAGVNLKISLQNIVHPFFICCLELNLWKCAHDGTHGSFTSGRSKNIIYVHICNKGARLKIKEHRCALN